MPRILSWNGMLLDILVCWSSHFRGAVLIAKIEVLSLTAGSTEDCKAIFASIYCSFYWWELYVISRICLSQFESWAIWTTQRRLLFRFDGREHGLLSKGENKGIFVIDEFSFWWRGPTFFSVASKYLFGLIALHYNKCRTLVVTVPVEILRTEVWWLFHYGNELEAFVIESFK